MKSSMRNIKIYQKVLILSFVSPKVFHMKVSKEKVDMIMLLFCKIKVMAQVRVRAKAIHWVVLNLKVAWNCIFYHPFILKRPKMEIGTQL